MWVLSDREIRAGGDDERRVHKCLSHAVGDGVCPRKSADKSLTIPDSKLPDENVYWVTVED
jgi:hypothetical protein